MIENSFSYSEVIFGGIHLEHQEIFVSIRWGFLWAHMQDTKLVFQDCHQIMAESVCFSLFIPIKSIWCSSEVKLSYIGSY